MPENSVAVDLLTEDTSFTPLWPRSVDLVAEQAAYEAEGPPLYLRNEVFLI